MRIGVAGIAGRMGGLVADEIVTAGGALVGGTCLPSDVVPAGAIVFSSIGMLAQSCDAIVDFTHASTVLDHADAVTATGCAWIIGTTGLDAAAQDAVRAASRRAVVVQAANFSPGVNLVLALAARLGAALPAAAYDAEIVEMHHRQKVDAPSGTALALGEAFASGRNVRLQDARIGPRDGHTGPRPEGGIGFAVLRGGQIVGEHSLVLTAADEQIVLTHRAFDRRSFARGAVRAALWSAGKPPGLYGMTDVLGMETDT
jgi:4-hydroxy-tetrahydrodipicolinate reductase